MPAGQVLQIGSDSSGQGARSAPAADGAARHLQRGTAGDRPAHRLPELQPIALPGARHLGHGQIRRSPASMGWLGRYLETVPRRSARRAGAPRANCRGRCMSRDGRRAGDSRTRGPTLSTARTPARRPSTSARAATRIASHVPVDRPHLAFVNSSAQAALATLDRVGVGGQLHRHRGVPEQRLRAWRCAPWPARSCAALGTRVFWVQTGGFDTHAGAGQRAARGSYAQPDGHATATAWRRSTTTCAIRALLNDTLCCSSPSSAAAYPRTAARAPIMAPPA